MTTADEGLRRARISLDICEAMQRDGLDVIAILGVLGVCVRWAMLQLPDDDRAYSTVAWAESFLGCQALVVPDPDDAETRH